MNIDHIFIFVDNKKIADELVNFGLIEGSGRVHCGQGTANRKFYFDNFFLEILWVHNKAELIISEQIKQTGLLERSNFKSNNCSPFGLCIFNSEDTDNLFKNSCRYQPDYFSKGIEIDIIKNENQTDLPWIFRLPFKEKKKNENEPIKHKNNIFSLTNAIFEYVSISESKFLEYFKNEQHIQFIKSTKCWLTLIFDNAQQGKTVQFKNLKLTIQY